MDESISLRGCHLSSKETLHETIINTEVHMPAIEAYACCGMTNVCSCTHRLLYPMYRGHTHTCTCMYNSLKCCW